MNLQKQQQLQSMQKDQHTPLKQNEDQNGYKESSYRFINFGIYCLAALVNSLPAQTFSSINSLVSDRFQYDQILVTLNTLFFPILHPLFAFPVNWILDKFGMRIGCTIGAVLVVAGVWMRTFLKVGDIFWCLCGSALAAIGNIFVLNSPSILANSWFKPQSIPGIISFAVLANLISLTFGGGIPGLLLDVKTSTAESIENFLRIQAIIVSVPMCIMVLGLKSRPKNPPSKSAQNQRKNKQNFKQTMQKLLKNREYMLLMVIMTLAYGGATSYLANMEQCLKSLDYSRSTSITSQVVLSAMFAGIISSFFIVKKIKSTLQYKSIMCISLLGTTIIFTLLQLILLRNPSSWASISIGILVGVFMIPTTSIFLSYSSEVIYPLGEGSATGFLFASAQTFGFLAGLGSAALIKLENDQPDGAEKWYVYIFMLAHVLCFFGSFIGTLFTKNSLNRTKYEKGTKKLSQIQSKFIFSAVA